MSAPVKGLPVPGYRPQSEKALAIVRAMKHHEEKLLRALDDLATMEDVDKRWLATGRTDVEKGSCRSIAQSCAPTGCACRGMMAMIDGASINRSMLVLAADAHWREARWWVRIVAVICGKHRVVDHLGCRNRIAVWRGVPYLWTIHEVSA